MVNRGVWGRSGTTQEGRREGRREEENEKDKEKKEEEEEEKEEGEWSSLMRFGPLW